MAHKYWCGKSCASCEIPCVLYKSMSCSPDCKNLGPDEELCLDCVGCAAAYNKKIDRVIYILTGFFDSPERDDDCWIVGIYETYFEAEVTLVRYARCDNRYKRFSISAHKVNDMARPCDRLRVWFYDGEGKQEDETNA